MIWYSLSVRVSAGATVMLSPVCTPIGSTFSIEHTMMQLSALSRTTSISYSFQPSRLSSMRICPTGEASMPERAICSNSSRLYATPPPVPPSVKAGRMIAGRPTVSRARIASANAGRRVVAHDMTGLVADRRRGGDDRTWTFEGRCGPSPRGTACGPRPCRWPRLWRRSSRRRTFPVRPRRSSASAVLSAVWPPMVGSSASGRSFSMILATISGVMGSM